MTTECVFDQRFDDKSMLQYVNNEISVLHCHHYATLFTKLAMNMPALGGSMHLRDSMEEATYLILKKHYITENVASQAEKVAAAESYFGLMGLGQLQLSLQSEGGSARMRHSHLDEGWIKKWGHSSTPVNFIGQGYLAGAFCVIMGHPIGFCDVEETASIVKGAPESTFSLKRKGA